MPGAVRRSVIADLARIIVVRFPGRRARVAVDGIDAAGKTTLADELARMVEDNGRTVIRASIDGFHQSRQQRYARGANSPEGYFRDSFDVQALITQLLIPLGHEGGGWCRTSMFDYRTDRLTNTSPVHASPDTILVFDGVFCQVPELAPHWDLTLFVDVAFDVSLAPAIQRDGHDRVESYLKRYHPGQRLYLSEVDPRGRADIVIDNNDLECPQVTIRDVARAGNI